MNIPSIKRNCNQIGLLTNNIRHEFIDADVASPDSIYENCTLIINQALQIQADVKPDLKKEGA